MSCTSAIKFHLIVILKNAMEIPQQKIHHHQDHASTTATWPQPRIFLFWPPRSIAEGITASRTRIRCRRWRTKKWKLRRTTMWIIESKQKLFSTLNSSTMSSFACDSMTSTWMVWISLRNSHLKNLITSFFFDGSLLLLLVEEKCGLWDYLLFSSHFFLYGNVVSWQQNFFLLFISPFTLVFVFFIFLLQTLY